MKTLILILLGIMLTSCAGYRVRKETNPFEQYQIQSLAVPMFVNRSTFAQVGGMMTNEIRQVLSTFPELKLTPQEDMSADGVLVGIIDSEASLLQSMRNTGTTFLSGGLQSSIGERPAFYLPTLSTVELYLTLVLIRRPSQEDLELLDTPFLPFLAKHPKVVFKETMRLSTSYSRSIQESIDSDSPGAVNATRNHKIMERSLKSLATRASRNFKNTIIHAF